MHTSAHKELCPIDRYINNYMHRTKLVIITFARLHQVQPFHCTVSLSGKGERFEMTTIFNSYKLLQAVDSPAARTYSQFNHVIWKTKNIPGLSPYMFMKQPFWTYHTGTSAWHSPHETIRRTIQILCVAPLYQLPNNKMLSYSHESNKDSFHNRWKGIYLRLFFSKHRLIGHTKRSNDCTISADQKKQ